MRRDHSRCAAVNCGVEFGRKDDVSIERVIPTKFGYFDLEASKKGQKAGPGKTWESRASHPDNLQVVHKVGCKKRDSPFVANWRHADCGPLPAANRVKPEQPRYLWAPRDP